MRGLWNEIMIYIKVLNAMYEGCPDLMQFAIAVSLGVLITTAGVLVIPLGAVLVLMRMVGSDPANEER